jgi:hypothetical protein
MERVNGVLERDKPKRSAISSTCLEELFHGIEKLNQLSPSLQPRLNTWYYYPQLKSGSKEFKIIRCIFSGIHHVAL